MSPVKQFMRAAKANYVLRDVRIPAEDAVLLSWAVSARHQSLVIAMQFLPDVRSLLPWRVRLVVAS